MRFKRCPFQKPAGFNWPRSPQRIAAAKKAVRLDKEKNALTPELVQHETSEERMDALDTHRLKWNMEMRQLWAQGWRKTRKQYFSLPDPIRSKLREYWTHNCGCPGDYNYLAGYVSQCRAGTFDPAVEIEALKEVRKRGEAWRATIGHISFLWCRHYAGLCGRPDRALIPVSCKTLESAPPVLINRVNTHQKVC